MTRAGGLPERMQLDLFLDGREALLVDCTRRF
jgi:hypothetical protein